jgi:hypothetical protein
MTRHQGVAKRHGFHDNIKRTHFSQLHNKGGKRKRADGRNISGAAIDKIPLIDLGGRINRRRSDASASKQRSLAPLAFHVPSLDRQSTLAFHYYYLHSTGSAACGFRVAAAAALQRCSRKASAQGSGCRSHSDSVSRSRWSTQNRKE